MTTDARYEVAEAIWRTDMNVRPSATFIEYCRFPDAYLRKADAALAALTSAGYEVVKLPEPGPLSDAHEDDQIVWYHGQYGEFIGETVRMNPPDPKPIMDEEGNCWGVGELREMALAALAAAKAAEAEQ